MAPARPEDKRYRTRNNPTSTPYRILVIGGISGTDYASEDAKTSAQAAKASANVVNAINGIMGHSVEIQAADDRADPVMAASLVREAVDSDRKPDAIINSGPSAVTAEILPILAAANILSFNLGPTATSSNPAYFPLNFDLSANAAGQLPATTLYLDKKSYQRVGILHSSSPYGQLYRGLAEERIASSNARIVGEVQYEVNADQLDHNLQELVSYAPDVILLDAYGMPVKKILVGMHALGLGIPIVGNTSVTATNLVGTPPPYGLLGAPEVEHLMMVAYRSCIYDPSHDQVNEAVKSMLALGPMPAAVSLAFSYDAVFLIRAAARAVGSIENSKMLASALEDNAVTRDASTAIRSEYFFSGMSHSPRMQPGDYHVIAPCTIKNGQFHPALL